MDGIRIISDWGIRKSIEDAMRIAIEEAWAARREGENPYGAVLLDPEYRFCHKAHSGSIAQSDPTAHAEIRVIREFCRMRDSGNLKGSGLRRRIS